MTIAKTTFAARRFPVAIEPQTPLCSSRALYAPACDADIACQLDTGKRIVAPLPSISAI